MPDQELLAEIAETLEKRGEPELALLVDKYAMEVNADIWKDTLYPALHSVVKLSVDEFGVAVNGLITLMTTHPLASKDKLVKLLSKWILGGRGKSDADYSSGDKHLKPQDWDATLQLARIFAHIVMLSGAAYLLYKAAKFIGSRVAAKMVKLARKHNKDPKKLAKEMSKLTEKERIEVAAMLVKSGQIDSLTRSAEAYTTVRGLL